MSDRLPPTAPDLLDDEDEEEQQELQFARCSNVPDEKEAPTTRPAEVQPPQEDKGTARQASSAAVKNDEPRPADPAAPPMNLRRSDLTRLHLLMSLGVSLVTGLLVYWAASSSFERRLAAASASSTTPAPAPVPGEKSTAAAEQIAALQKQVDVMRREQLLLQQNTRESLEDISETLKNPRLVAAPALAAKDAKPGESRVAEMVPAVSPTQQEFIQLKERNRLTQYADEAIATGLRKPLEVLVEYLRDPASAHLHDAAKAEYLRAIRSIQFLQREDPGFRLPVAEIFKDPNIRDEADVKPDALLKLLADHQQPWEVRVRVCFLLLGSELPETNAKLIQALKEDPSLDVAKHAQLALEQRIKRRFRLFDIPAIDEWVESQKK